MICLPTHVCFLLTRPPSSKNITTTHTCSSIQTADFTSHVSRYYLISVIYFSLKKLAWKGIFNDLVNFGKHFDATLQQIIAIDHVNYISPTINPPTTPFNIYQDPDNEFIPFSTPSYTVNKRQRHNSAPSAVLLPGSMSKPRIYLRNSVSNFTNFDTIYIFDSRISTTKSKSKSKSKNKTSTFIPTSHRHAVQSSRNSPSRSSTTNLSPVLIAPTVIISRSPSLNTLPSTNLSSILPVIDSEHDNDTPVQITPRLDSRLYHDSVIDDTPDLCDDSDSDSDSDAPDSDSNSDSDSKFNKYSRSLHFSTPSQNVNLTINDNSSNLSAYIAPLSTSPSHIDTFNDTASLDVNNYNIRPFNMAIQLQNDSISLNNLDLHVRLLFDYYLIDFNDFAISNLDLEDFINDRINKEDDESVVTHLSLFLDKIVTLISFFEDFCADNPSSTFPPPNTTDDITNNLFILASPSSNNSAPSISNIFMLSTFIPDDNIPAPHSPIATVQDTPEQVEIHNISPLVPVSLDPAIA